jgi:hypothetical protein
MSFLTLRRRPKRSLSPARPGGGFELAIYDGGDMDYSIAVVWAIHYNKLAKLLDAMSEIDETAGDIIRHHGDTLRPGVSQGFHIRGYFCELTEIGSRA